MICGCACLVLFCCFFLNYQLSIFKNYFGFLSFDLILHFSCYIEFSSLHARKMVYCCIAVILYFSFWRGRRYKCTFQPFLEIFLAICSWIDHTVVVGTTETCKLFIMKEIIEIVDIRWQCISNHLHVKSQEIQIKEVLS